MTTLPKGMEKTSRFLTMLLRHRALDPEFKLTMDNGGYVSVQELLAIPQLSHLKLEDIQELVESNDKKRFELEKRNGNWYLRCSQGHSGKVAERIDDRVLLIPIEDASMFPVCVHGTYSKPWKLISSAGHLSRMARKHIHFTTGLPEDDSVVSGMRTSASVIIFLDLEKALADGIPFFLSSNNVILSPGITDEKGNEGVIPLRYVTKAVYRTTGKTVWINPE